MSFDRASVLETGTALVFHTVLALSLYLLFAGHNQPGGGFIGGLVAAGAFVLRFLSGERARPVTRVRPEVLMGLGLVLALGTGMAAWLGGGELLESGKLEVDLPLLGTVKAFSVLAFDGGVYLVVVGLVGAVLDGLGDAPGRRAGDDGADDVTPTDVSIGPGEARR